MHLVSAGETIPTVVLQSVASALGVGLVSLVGIAAVAVSPGALQRLVFGLVSLAAGALFGDAVIHLLPEALQQSANGTVTSLFVLGGIFAFFTLEKFLRWRHQHFGAADDPSAPVGTMNLIADAVHNLIDGMAIGAGYLAGPAVGLATTLAVILHEVPQELGDFGILVHAGFTRAQALLFNFLTACTAIAGALLAVMIGASDARLAPSMQALTAGMFLYIAGSDLVPDLHKEHDPSRSLVQLAAMALGAGAMLALVLLD